MVDLQVPVRRVATVTPYVLGGMQRAYTLDDETGRIASSSTRPSEVGADLKFGLTPSLTLDLTYNTDFAQVEVDEQRTNLTRFPLFFPEKRPFFLENAGIFSAGTPQAVELFFTRRIGIDSIGRPVPIIGGGRTSGRVAGLTVGALQLFTEDVDDGPPTTSYSVMWRNPLVWPWTLSISGCWRKFPRNAQVCTAGRRAGVNTLSSERSAAAR